MAQKKDRFEKLTNVREVTRISSAPIHMVCMTMIYSIFSHRKGNRNGIQERRVANLIKKIKADRFYPVLGLIFVDRRGVIIDGHHRFEALQREGKPIVFMVVTNMTIEEIADYNTNKVSPSWKNPDNFGSALDLDYELAHKLDTVRMELLDELAPEGLTESLLDIGGMYAILTGNHKHFGNGADSAVTLDHLKDNSLVPKAQSDEYYEHVKAYAKLKCLWSENMHKRYKACKVIMECSFPKNKKAKNFDIKYFMENVTATNFEMRDNSKTDDFIREAVRIHNIRRPKHLKADVV